MNVEFWGGFIVALFTLGGIVYVLARAGRLPSANKDASMTRMQLEQKLAELERKSGDLASTVKVLQNDHVRDAQRIGQLERELAEAQARIRFLEGRLAQYESNDENDGAGNFPLLVICGPEQQFADDDLSAVRQARVPFRRILAATRAKIEAELLRRRDAGDLYRWLHVSAHAGPQGILLADGLAERIWWNEQLQGIEGAFLAGCEDVAVADWLIGLVGWVVSTTEEIRTDRAGRFTKAFWESLYSGKTPKQAYQRACNVVPQFAEYTDFREAKR